MSEMGFFKKTLFSDFSPLFFPGELTSFPGSCGDTGARTREVETGHRRGIGVVER